MTNIPEESTKIFTVLREELAFAWRLIRCAIYISFWRARHFLIREPTIRKATTFAALIASLVLTLDLILFFLQLELVHWLGRNAVIVLIPCTVLLICHRASEIKTEKNEHIFSQQFIPLADARGRIFAAAPANKKAELDKFVGLVLQMISDDFKRRHPTNVNAMFPADNEKLAIVYLYPVGTKYDPDFSIGIGQGGAGYCYRTRKIVYIPSIHHLHGIIVGIPEYGTSDNGKSMYGIKRRLYMEIPKEYEIFASILSVPIVSQSGIHGVLNIDSEHTDAFDNHDFHLLKAYGRAIGEGISLAVVK